MDLQAVDIGTEPNDGTGDEIRGAFAKINQNFAAIENLAGAQPVSDFAGFVVLDSEEGLALLTAIVASMIGDGQVSNAKLANVATATLKGRVAEEAGVPTDLSAAQVKELLDLDHMTTLTGVAAAAENLGVFAEGIIPDDQTVKGALQALETALEEVVQEAPRVAFIATSTKAAPSGTGTVLDDLDSISAGTLGNSILSNGIFTVGSGDAGWYEAYLQYKPVDTGADYTRVNAFVTPNAGVQGQRTTRLASGTPVWVQAVWAGILAEGNTLSFSIVQVNGASATRSGDTGTHIAVRRVAGTPA